MPWAGLALLAVAAPAQVQFEELTPRLNARIDNTFAVALGDVDGDGDLDLILGNWGPNRLYLNDGTGRFTDATAIRLPGRADRTKALALGDVDGDSDPDLVVGNFDASRQNRLYLNDGTGRFTDVTSVRMPTDDDETNAVVLGDVDGDGDPDLVLGNSDRYLPGVRTYNRLYLNDGGGRFTDATALLLPPFLGTTWAIAMGDVDGDGDPDLVLGTDALAKSQLYLNDGTGKFADATSGRMPPYSVTYHDETVALAMGDVDGDGDPDLVLGNRMSGAQCLNSLFLNDGTGRFNDGTLARLPTKCGSTWAVALGDVDEDGDPDIVFGNSGFQPDRLHLNDGTGVFRDVTASRMPFRHETFALAIGDVDNDGDRDLILGNAAVYGGVQRSRLYLNLLRQLDAPLLAKPGLPYQLDVYARYGPQRLIDVGVPYVSSGTAQVPLQPMGTFGLDPTQMVALPPVIVSQPAGVGSASFTMPNLPGLVGATVYAQALLVQYPALARLTNVTVDVILR